MLLLFSKTCVSLILPQRWDDHPHANQRDYYVPCRDDAVMLMWVSSFLKIVGGGLSLE